MKEIDIVKEFLNYIQSLRSCRYLSSDELTLLNHNLHQLVSTLAQNNIILSWTGSMQKYYDRMYIHMRIIDNKRNIYYAEKYIPC